MARNKCPEDTVNKILDVSLKLFLEKGYDNTSIQDIIDQLGGLSKGAIYHHFKSKESILLAVYDKLGEKTNEEMDTIRDSADLNGMKKLQMMFLSSWKNSEHREFIASMPDLLENPKLLAIHLSATIHHIVPEYVLPVIEEGKKDGSIHTENPRELADFLMLLTNVWLNPLIYPMDEERINERIKFFEEILSTLNLPLVDKSMSEHIHKLEEKKEQLKNK